METRKIAVACFIGGTLCCAVALMFASIYWWFGMIAGFAGGYISYEFREVLKAIPVAVRSAQRNGSVMWGEIFTSVKVWLSQPHPFGYPAMAMATPVAVWYVYNHNIFPVMKIDSTPDLIIMVILQMIITPVAFIELTWAMMLPLIIFGFIGARASERCYWYPFLMKSRTMELEAVALDEKGLQREPLNYRNLTRWVAKGIGLTIIFFAWTVWKFLAIAVWATICFLGRFAWHLFKLIHSEKRVLCAIDGTLGGAASYIWFAAAAISFPEQAMFVIFGGLLGAAFGVANWEIVSKRILRVAHESNA